MSLSRLFLGGLRSRRARLRLTGQTQNAVQWSCRSRDLQRTAMSVLTVCANRGGNPSSGWITAHPEVWTGEARFPVTWLTETSGFATIRPERQNGMRFHVTLLPVHHENSLIAAFVKRTKRERYREIVSDSRLRHKFTAQLAHFKDFDPRYRIPIPSDKLFLA